MMKPFVQFERATMQWLVHSYQRRSVRRAARAAYAQFADLYPQWVATLFDVHFVDTHLLPMLLKAATTGGKVAPAEVAEAWARQISLLPSLRQQHIARVLPVATHFLCMVAEEVVETEVGPTANLLVERAVG
ncbi:MAG: hypothetical protein IT328_12185 [Caldilineaceae bacterium]|nr:hypothetical protein [Caldilineaceae bacterium]